MVELIVVIAGVAVLAAFVSIIRAISRSRSRGRFATDLVDSAIAAAAARMKQERQDRAHAVLLRIYEISNGRPDQAIRRKDLANVVGMSRRDLDVIADELTAIKAVRYIMFGSLALTEYGVNLAQNQPGGIARGRSAPIAEGAARVSAPKKKVIRMVPTDSPSDVPKG